MANWNKQYKVLRSKPLVVSGFFYTSVVTKFIYILCFLFVVM